MHPQNMTHEQLLNHHLRKVKQWKEEKEWYILELGKKREGKLMKQLQFLLVENSQLHKELEECRELIDTYRGMQPVDNGKNGVPTTV